MTDRSFHVEQTVLEIAHKCPICGGEAFQPGPTAKDHLVSQRLFETHICEGCGLCQTSPRPTPEEIGRYYDSDAYISHTNEKTGLTSTLYQRIREHTLRQKLHLIRQRCPSGAVLDIGCGTGEFLALLQRKGYRTQGIEPSPAARRQAEQNHRLSVQEDLTQIPAQEQYDVITMWHVLEHMHDIAKTVAQVRARLRPNGWFIVAVPDRESWDAYHYGPNWAAYDVPRHLSHFRREDVTRLLAQEDIAVVQTRPMWFDAFYVSLLSERQHGAGPLMALSKGLLIGGWSNLVALTTSRPTSSSLFIAQKREGSGRPIS